MGFYGMEDETQETKEFVSSPKPCKRWGWEENLSLSMLKPPLPQSASLALYLAVLLQTLQNLSTYGESIGYVFSLVKQVNLNF